MVTTAEPILDAEIDAYVDGQMDLDRRIEIEALLARNPPLASRVMDALRLRDELRAAFGGEPEIPPAPLVRKRTERLARRLQGSRSRTRMVVGLKRAAAAALLVGAGWAANAALGPLLIGTVFAYPQAPAYVSDAVMSHRTALLRAGMRSQVETPEFDRDEVRAATAIVVPKLPRDWKVLDAQVFPSKYGPSLQMAIETPDLGLISFYAVRPGVFDMEAPVVRAMEGAQAAYWQVADVAYTLVAQHRGEELLARAQRFAGKLDPYKTKPGARP
ncbi:transcriptional regulator, anti-sigma factor [Methylopila jiangsuensis]|uniref:Transcriptional regulator, anti-sigma factor n=1 Tax=Methylopila jiangsuensis TaxID=586230 RepID=A0A9W6JJM4_9HYPH|nr:anti-sigma factor [Methylopila jiangsuensis]MDR6286889.1 anti-sigma factor RsiW [Methylopila jiangsuensis]GLK76763.1 transcriptional regulator, anti-sigma factor [Methylopila jiangsuensis]